MRSKLRVSVTTALVAVLAVAAAACGSDASSSNDTSAAATTGAATDTAVASTTGAATDTAVASTTNAASDTTAAPSETTAGGDEVAAAQAIFDGFTKPPVVTQLPLKAKPEAGKTVVYIDCGSPGCNQQGKYIKEAAGLVGWKVVDKSHDMTDPSTLVSLLTEVLTMNPKPVAVLFAGSAAAVWSSLVPQYEAAGIAIVPNSDTLATKPDSPSVPAIVVTDTDSKKIGSALANWFIADSKAAGKALIVNYPDVTTLAIGAKATEEAIAAGCAKCSSQRLDLSIVQLGGGEGGPVPAIVAALQADPSITNVISMYSETTTGLPGALDAANIKGVHVGGAYPSLENLQGLIDGTSQAWTTTNTKAFGYLMFDVALRFAEGSPIQPDDGGVPLMVFTKDNIGTPTEESPFVPADMTEQFKKLWLVG